MGISSRSYISNDGEIRRISRRLRQQIEQYETRLPDYRKQSVRVLYAHILFEDRRPTKIDFVECSLWKFDETGLLDEGWEWHQQKEMAHILNLSFNSKSSPPHVLDIEQIRQEKGISETHLLATPHEIRLISEEIWPKN